LWLLSVDEEVAVRILGELEESEVQRLHEAAKSLKQVSAEQIAMVHREYFELTRPGVLRLRGTTGYLGRLVEQAMGSEKAAALFGPSTPETPEEPSGLEHADVGLLASVLSREHPQIIAAVVAHIDPERAAMVVQQLDEELRREVIGRVATIGPVPPDALERVEKVLAAGLPTTETDAVDVDGVRTAAVLLNRLVPDEAEDLLNALEGHDAEAAASVRRAMFRFDDLVELDTRGFQTLLKEVQSDQLLLALKTAPEELRKKVFASLSKRAAEMLRDDLEVMGPARLSDVELAQQAVVDVALQLRAEGTLNIAGQGGEEFV
jgi:flagellar motor switch protein FliG